MIKKFVIDAALVAGFGAAFAAPMVAMQYFMFKKLEIDEQKRAKG